MSLKLQSDVWTVDQWIVKGWGSWCHFCVISSTSDAMLDRDKIKMKESNNEQETYKCDDKANLFWCFIISPFWWCQKEQGAGKRNNISPPIFPPSLPLSMPGSVWPDLKPPWAPQSIWRRECELWLSGCLTGLWGPAAWELHSASSARHWASLCPRSRGRLRQQIAVKSQGPSPAPKPSRISMRKTATPSVMWDTANHAQTSYTSPTLVIHWFARTGRSWGLRLRPGLEHC